MAHTRWATHGAPTEVNAHPHTDDTGRIALVHNGIIENYATLKQFLTDKGHTFYSQTDTEVLAMLIGDLYTRSRPRTTSGRACRCYSARSRRRCMRSRHLRHRRHLQG